MSMVVQVDHQILPLPLHRQHRPSHMSLSPLHRPLQLPDSPSRSSSTAPMDRRMRPVQDRGDRLWMVMVHLETDLCSMGTPSLLPDLALPPTAMESTGQLVLLGWGALSRSSTQSRSANQATLVWGILRMAPSPTSPRRQMSHRPVDRIYPQTHQSPCQG